MMAAEERQALLNATDDDEYEGAYNRKSHFRTSNIRGNGDVSNVVSPSSTLSQIVPEIDNVVCVFVVTFDTRSGKNRSFTKKKIITTITKRGLFNKNIPPF